jgi:hypothetical protein
MRDFRALYVAGGGERGDGTFTICTSRAGHSGIGPTAVIRELAMGAHGSAHCLIFEMVGNEGLRWAFLSIIPITAVPKSIGTTPDQEVICVISPASNP